jgi:tetratricopeptide (TPR) repeat protein
MPAEEEEQAALYRSLLAGRRVLVVLDNAATAEQVRPLLPGSAGCMAVVTSRCRLSGLAARDGAQRINLDVLPAAQAVAVLAQSAGAARVDAEPDAADELARLCGRLPLALRIAAERVASRPRSALADLAGELAGARSRLDLLRAGDDDATAVRAVFSWSYRSLPPDAVGVFRSLGLLAGPDVCASAVAALIAADTATARQLLELLATMYLVEESGQDRYRLHDLLRLYAAERALAEDGDEDRTAARRRVLDWYLHTANAANNAITCIPCHFALDAAAEGCVPLTFATARQALDWYETEHGNLMASIRMAAETGRHVAAWQIPVTMLSHFIIRKPWHDVIASLQLGLAAARETGDRTGEAWMLGLLGYAYRVRCPEEAIGYCHQALAIFRELGDRWCQGHALNTSARASMDLRRFEETVTTCRQALSVHREIDNRPGEVDALNTLSAAYQGMGRFSEAISYSRQALSIMRETGDLHGEGITLTKLGAALRAAGRPDAARHCWRDAVAILEGLASPKADQARTLLEKPDQGQADQHVAETPGRSHAEHH